MTLEMLQERKKIKRKLLDVVLIKVAYYTLPQSISYIN